MATKARELETRRLNISGGTVTSPTGNLLMVGGYSGYAATGLVNQSGGSVNIGGNGMLLGWNSTAGEGAYLLSAGTLNCTGGMAVCNQGAIRSVRQTGGVATDTSNLYIAYYATGLGTGVVDISGGTLTHTTGTVMSVGQGSARRHRRPDRSRRRLFPGTGRHVHRDDNAAAKGIVNVLTGGTLEVNRIYMASGGTSTINFDGGTLGPIRPMPARTSLPA